MTVNMAKQPIVVAIVRYVDLHSLTAGLTDAGMVRVSMVRGNVLEVSYRPLTIEEARATVREAWEILTRQPLSLFCQAELAREQGHLWRALVADYRRWLAANPGVGNHLRLRALREILADPDLKEAE